MTTTNYNTLIQETLENASSFNDLLPMLKHIPIKTLKQTITANLANLDLATRRTMCLQTSSIEMILPHHLIKRILKFLSLECHQETISLINTKWHKYRVEHEKNCLLDTKRAVLKSTKVHDATRENVNIFTVHPTRTKLTNIERELGFKGPYKYFEDVMNVYKEFDGGVSIIPDAEPQSGFKPGDIILMYPGRWEYLDEFEIEKHVTIAGVYGYAKRPTINGPDGYGTPILLIRNRAFVHIENVDFDFAWTKSAGEGLLDLGECCKLWLNKCKFRFDDTGIIVHKQSYLNVDKCVFEKATTAIEISPCADKVEVYDSTFSGCGEMHDRIKQGQSACIYIFDQFGESKVKPNQKNKRNSNIQLVELICSRNMFKNNWCYPIAERSEKTRNEKDNDRDIAKLYMEEKELYTLRNNKLEGYNRALMRQWKDVVDANKIYLNIK